MGTDGTDDTDGMDGTDEKKDEGMAGRQERWEPHCRDAIYRVFANIYSGKEMAQ